MRIEEDIIEIQNEVKIPQKDKDIILEKGDKIKILEYEEKSIYDPSLNRTIKSDDKRDLIFEGKNFYKTKWKIFKFKENTGDYLLGSLDLKFGYGWDFDSREYDSFILRGGGRFFSSFKMKSGRTSSIAEKLYTIAIQEIGDIQVEEKDVLNWVKAIIDISTIGKDYF
jgi:hypothetical protein